MDVVFITDPLLTPSFLNYNLFQGQPCLSQGVQLRPPSGPSKL